MLDSVAGGPGGLAQAKPSVASTAGHAPHVLAGPPPVRDQPQMLEVLWAPVWQRCSLGFGALPASSTGREDASLRSETLPRGWQHSLGARWHCSNSTAPWEPRWCRRAHRRRCRRRAPAPGFAGAAGAGDKPESSVAWSHHLLRLIDNRHPSRNMHNRCTTVSSPLEQLAALLLTHRAPWTLPSPPLRAPHPHACQPCRSSALHVCCNESVSARAPTKCRWGRSGENGRRRAGPQGPARPRRPSDIIDISGSHHILKRQDKQVGENWHLFWQNQIPSEQAAWGGLGPRGQGKGAGNRKTSPRVHCQTSTAGRWAFKAAVWRPRGGRGSRGSGCAGLEK